MRMKKEECEKRGVQGLGSQMLAWLRQCLPPPLLPPLPPQCTVTALGFLRSSTGLMKCPGQTNRGGGILREPQADASRCRMGSSGVSLDFLITRSYYANPSLLLQCLREEEERVRTRHFGPLLTLLSVALRVGQGPGVFGKDRGSGKVLFFFFFFPSPQTRQLLAKKEPQGRRTRGSYAEE